MDRNLRIARAAALLGLYLVLMPAMVAEQMAWWPRSGSVILGGGTRGAFDAVARRLIALAGGPDSLIVIIPTANHNVAPRLRGSGPPFDTDELKKLMESKGAHRVAVLHTRDRQVADSEKFAGILRTAGGVWIPGGGPRILAETYGGTLVARELQALLARGGAIAGDSAGAIAIGCFMPPTPFLTIVQGLSILPNLAVVPHATSARGYSAWEEALKYLVAHPGPVAAVVDDETALVLRQNSAEVIGAGSVSLLDPSKDRLKPYRLLKAGDTLDVAK